MNFNPPYQYNYSSYNPIEECYHLEKHKYVVGPQANALSIMSESALEINFKEVVNCSLHSLEESSCEIANPHQNPTLWSSLLTGVKRVTIRCKLDAVRFEPCILKVLAANKEYTYPLYSLPLRESEKSTAQITLPDGHVLLNSYLPIPEKRAPQKKIDQLAGVLDLRPQKKQPEYASFMTEISSVRPSPPLTDDLLFSHRQPGLECLGLGKEFELGPPQPTLHGLPQSSKNSASQILEEIAQRNDRLSLFCFTNSQEVIGPLFNFTNDLSIRRLFLEFKENVDSWFEEGEGAQCFRMSTEDSDLTSGLSNVSTIAIQYTPMSAQSKGKSDRAVLSIRKQTGELFQFQLQGRTRSRPNLLEKRQGLVNPYYSLQKLRENATADSQAEADEQINQAMRRAVRSLWV